MKPQSVLNYIERNRAGLVRSLVQTSLEASGYKIEALETPEMAAVRSRLELSILTGIGYDGLKEPPASMLLSDVADVPPPPAEAGALPATSDRETEQPSKAEYLELAGDPEIGAHPPPPPLRKRR